MSPRPSTAGFETRAPDPATDADEVIDLASKIFGGPRQGYFGFRDMCRRAYVLGSHFDWDVSRIGRLDGRLVSNWSAWGFRMRIGRDTVRTAGVGIVCTHPDFRKRGFLARTARASLDACRRAGYRVSILDGIPDFYHRFGYVRAWRDPVYIVRVRDLPSARPAVRPTRMDLGPGEALAERYNRSYAGLTGTAVRPTYAIVHNHITGWEWPDAQGLEGGYVVFRDFETRPTVIEATGDPDQALRVIASAARHLHRREVRFSTLPWAHPVAARLRRGNCRLELKYARRGEAMIRTLDLAGALADIAPELGRRLRASTMGDWRGRLLVADSRERVLLVIDRGKVRTAPPERTPHAIRGGDEVAQLLIGTDATDEVLEAGGMRTAGDGRALARALFPDRHPMLSRLDVI